MKKINKFFNIVGTNPQMYFKNFLIKLCIFKKGDILLIYNGVKLIHNNDIVFETTKTTLAQNIALWEALGFVEVVDDKLIVLVNSNGDEEYLYDVAKESLLCSNDKEKVNKLRNTILIKLLVLSNENFKNKLINKEILLKSKTRDVYFEDVESEIGAFEEKLLTDKIFLNIINLLEIEVN